MGGSSGRDGGGGWGGGRAHLNSPRTNCGECGVLMINDACIMTNVCSEERNIIELVTM
jgi:hypothetical protein